MPLGSHSSRSGAAAHNHKRKGPRPRLPSTPLSPRDSNLQYVCYDNVAQVAVTRSRILTGRSGGARSKGRMFPRRLSNAADEEQSASGRSIDTVPQAPGVLYAAMTEAIKAANVKWATTNPEVAALLSPEITYVDLRGEESVGVPAVLESMDAGIERLLTRISRSTRSGKQEVRAMLEAGACKH